VPDDTSLLSGQEALGQAVAAHRADRLDEAEALYLAALRGLPDHAGAHHNLGILLAQKGRPDLGVPYLKRASEIAPGQVQHHISYAEALFAAGRGPEAKQVLEAAGARGLSAAALQQAWNRMAARPDSETARLLQEAVRFHRDGALEEAAAAYRRILERHPNQAEVRCNLGTVLKSSGDLSGAKAAFEQAMALAPGLVNAPFNLGNLHREQGDWEAAAASYRMALGIKPFPEGHNNLGSVLLAMGRTEEAIVSFRQALALKPEFAAGHNNLGNALRQAGRAGEARAAYETALRQDPQHAEALHGLGILLSDAGDHAEAERHLRQALSLRPDYAQGHNSLGNLLVKEGRLGDAIAHYETALRCDPAYVEAYDHLGLALCKAHRVPEGFARFTEGARRRLTVKPVARVSAHSQAHDRELADYRAALGLAEASLFVIEGGEALMSPAVNRKSSDIEAQWLSASPQIAVIDDLLSPEALRELRRFCLASTIWEESFEEGYVGARPESGFASPLLAQIADELRAAFPAIFRDYPLLSAWSFKYDNRLRGTRIHADFAAVNVNFWITPDEANLDKKTGGLVVWDAAAPLDWDFERYNRDEDAIRKFLAEKNAKSVRIPYRANRAVIFDSDLFHETDAMAFADGYENRRINITLLYGDRKTGA
jgi:tetratricopeptide (TPR) repeat protein